MNDKRIKKEEGGKTEEMEEGMEAKRKGTGKERTILHYIFYRNHIYNILILTVSLISDGSVTSPPCAFKRLALTGI